MNDRITVQTQLNASIEKVWSAYTEPEAIKSWNAASDDWHTTAATNDLRVGGRFTYRMEAKDGSAGFDFGGTYTGVDTNKRIAYEMDDGRKAETLFESAGDGVTVTVKFDPENENPIEMQRAGWQSILDSYKRFVESSE